MFLVKNEEIWRWLENLKSSIEICLSIQQNFLIQSSDQDSSEFHCSLVIIYWEPWSQVPHQDSFHISFLILTPALGIAYCPWPIEEGMGLERFNSLPRLTQVVSSWLESNLGHRNTHSPAMPQSLLWGMAAVRPKEYSWATVACNLSGCLPEVSLQTYLQPASPQLNSAAHAQ